MEEEDQGAVEAKDGADASEPQETGRSTRYARYCLAALVLLMGVLAGVGTFTFSYGKGSSYLSNDPNSCVNCHAMQDHFDTWQQSSHAHVAVCNDCHLPHDFVGKWVTKADNGLFHSISFTMQDYHEPIQIKPRNRVVTQNACIDCHGDFVHSLLPVGQAEQQDMLSCVHCHADVGHAFRSYSSGSRRDPKVLRRGGD